MNEETKITIKGKFVKIASIENEWFVDVKEPASMINEMKNGRNKADIFTFWQRLPDMEPKYNYHMEWDNVAALQVKSFDQWWKNQINAKTRNMIRKSQKKGVQTRVVNFSDELVDGIKKIFDESPIRQGKPFWHYEKDFSKVKEEMSDRLDHSEFIGAYYDDELIGFIKLLHVDNYTMIVEILSMIQHRDKSPTNALVAKAVEICEEKNIPFLVYAKWSWGTLGDFKKRSGFEKIELPRYFIPLNIKGKLILLLHLHNGIKAIIPKPLKSKLILIRKKLYTRKMLQSA
ncbi:MAG: hypothetical protein GTO02_05170 [Candidatus Dadabacteria bacterium]|nr:hypothetical protein [Candidatus Dadabacteria bacterium]